MKKKQQIDIILGAVREAQQGSKARKVLFAEDKVAGKHEFLFFIKPEITIESSSIKLEAILHLILDTIEKFGLGIRNALLLPAAYLEKHDIIARHYGVINAIARDAKNSLSDSAKARFESEFGTAFSGSPIYGGIEFMNAFPMFTPVSLDYLWQNSPSHKLGGGAYAQCLTMDGRKVFLVNGFHPRQLEHFIMEGRSIVAFTLCGDIDWSDARNSFIGKTDPSAAEAESLRRKLLEQKDELGLPLVNSSRNGVHLSAGPVEGLVELIRYNTDFSSGEKLQPSAYSFWASLVKHFEQADVNKILSNVNVISDGREISIFDLTEEKNADKALEILREVFPGQ